MSARKPPRTPKTGGTAKSCAPCRQYAGCTDQRPLSRLASTADWVRRAKLPRRGGRGEDAQASKRGIPGVFDAVQLLGRRRDHGVLRQVVNLAVDRGRPVAGDAVHHIHGPLMAVPVHLPAGLPLGEVDGEANGAGGGIGHHIGHHHPPVGLVHLDSTGGVVGKVHTAFLLCKSVC